MKLAMKALMHAGASDFFQEVNRLEPGVVVDEHEDVSGSVALGADEGSCDVGVDEAAWIGPLVPVGGVRCTGGVRSGARFTSDVAGAL